MFTFDSLITLLWGVPTISDFDPAIDLDDTILRLGDVVTVLHTNPCVGVLRGEIVDIDFDNMPYPYRVETCVNGCWQAPYYAADELEKVYD